MPDWLLLHYKLPSEPSAPRVAVWRRLKRLGAVLWLDAVWVLPCSAHSREQFQWLAAEIVELGGEAALWEALPALPGPADGLEAQFRRQAEAGFRAILAQLEGPQPDLDELSRQYQQALQRDYFQTELGRRTRQALLARRGESS